jgi:hypothetical protein
MEADQFKEMSLEHPEGKYYTPSAYEGVGNAAMSSEGRPAHPMIFPEAATTPIPASDINAPAGGEAYDRLAAESLAEDLDAMAGQHRFGERELPAPPITDDMFRYTGDFNIRRGDPLLSSPMIKADIGISNRGIGLWS